MNPRIAVPLILAALAGTAVVLYVASRPAPATLLIVNAKVYTADPAHPTAEAVAVNGDAIAGVGTTEELRRSFAALRELDLGGKTVVPGFIDAHAHVEGLGAFLRNLDVTGAADPADILAMVKARIAGTPAGQWVRGRGWDQNRWPVKDFPTATMLDAVAPDHPVYLTRVDGHAVWVNSRAMELAGITAATPDPPGGKILRLADGVPAGVFVDEARELFDEHLPDPAPAERMEAVELALREAVRVGLTGVHDMGVDASGIRIYEDLIAAGKMPLRVYAAVDGTGETWNEVRQRGPVIGAGGERLTVRALKVYVDGALGSRGAALIESYADDPGNRGITLLSQERLTALTTQALESGFQVCAHAIGDRANHIALNAFAAALGARGRPDGTARLRIEHAQVLAPEDIPRFAALGILPVVQPTHCTSDMPWAPARLGPRRTAGAYAWRSLIAAGSILPAGSDFPVERPDPLRGFYAAVTRQDEDGQPPGGWAPDQVLTREEALAAFTLWAATAAFEEGRKGSITPGKLADMTVLSADIMTIPPAEILTTEVEMTILGGVTVFARDLLASRTAEANAQR